MRRALLVAAFLLAALPVAAEAQEIVVLADDLAARAGEVEREGRHVAAQVVDVEDEVPVGKFLVIRL